MLPTRSEWLVFSQCLRFQRPFEIDQDVGDVLHVAHFVVAAPHFEERIVGGGFRIGRVQQQHAAEARARRPSGESSRPEGDVDDTDGDDTAVADEAA
jgi:hypothetical protein